MALVVGESSYLSLEDAAAYFEDRLGGEAWAGADDGARETALRMAFVALEALPLRGAVASPTQKAQWPRRGLFDARGVELPSGEIPASLKAAQCEEALALLQLAADPGSSARASLQAQGVMEARLGQVEERYQPAKKYAGLRSPEAFSLVKSLLIRTPRRVFTDL